MRHGCHNPRSSEFSVTVCTPTSVHRVLKLLFGRDGSIYVTFPGLTISEGIAAPVTVPPGEQFLNINMTAKQTGHVVKYSHHASGEALFSLTRKVRTEAELRRNIAPLTTFTGTLFVMQIQDMSAFVGPGKSKAPSVDLAFPHPVNSMCLSCIRAPLSQLLASGTSFCVSPPSGTPFDDFGLVFITSQNPLKKSPPAFIFLGACSAPNGEPAKEADPLESLVLFYPWPDKKTPDGRDLESIDIASAVQAARNRHNATNRTPPGAGTPEFHEKGK